MFKDCMTISQDIFIALCSFFKLDRKKVMKIHWYYYYISCYVTFLCVLSFIYGNSCYYLRSFISSQRTPFSISCRADMIIKNFHNFGQPIMSPNYYLPPQAATMFNIYSVDFNKGSQRKCHSYCTTTTYILPTHPIYVPENIRWQEDLQNDYFNYWVETALTKKEIKMVCMEYNLTSRSSNINHVSQN